MKKTAIYYINLFLGLVILVLIVMHLAIRIQNKEFSKLSWGAEIHSAKDGNSRGANLIKVIDAIFYDSTNRSVKGLDYDAYRRTEGYISAENLKWVGFSTYDKELLPDSLSFSYYSVDERKFYKINAPLPYEKLKKAANGIKGSPTILLKIFPQGNVVLAMKSDNDNDAKPENLVSLTAKTFPGDLEMVVYVKTLEGKYNDLDDITTLDEYGDLVQNRYNWGTKFSLPEGGKLDEPYAVSFARENIKMSAEAAANPIPKTLYIDWQSRGGDGKKTYSIQYELNAKQALDAFRTLAASGNPAEPITLMVHLSNQKNPHCELTKDGKIIPLVDMYPEDSH